MGKFSRRLGQLRGVDRRKKGLSSIIGGILVVGIFMTAGLTFIYTEQQDFNSLAASTSQKVAEHFQITASTITSDSDIGIIVNNTGRIIITIASIIVTNVTANPPTDYLIETSPAIFDTSTPMLIPWISVGPGNNSYAALHDQVIDTHVRLDSSVSYTIEVITQRGTTLTVNYPIPNSNNLYRESEVSSGFGSFVFQFNSFKYFDDDHGGPNTLVGDGWYVGGYYGFDTPQAIDSVYQLKVQNLDPNGLSITISEQSAIVLGPNGGPGVTYYIVGDLLEQADCTGTGDCVDAYPYISPITVPYAGYALLNFSAPSPGGCAGAGQTLDGVNCQAAGNTNHGDSPIILTITGKYSNGALYGQTVPTAATYGTNAGICSTGYPFKGTGGTVITVTISGGPPCGPDNFLSEPSIYWVSSTGTVSNVTTLKTATTTSFTIPTHTVGYYAIYAFDGVNAAYATVNVTG
jgi:hypothetical protein